MRNTPTGIMPVKECRRRQKNECPCPARNGATPARIVTGVVVLGADTATTLPCRLGDDQRLHHYLGRQERKSRRASQHRLPEMVYRQLRKHNRRRSLPQIFSRSPSKRVELPGRLLLGGKFAS